VELNKPDSCAACPLRSQPGPVWGNGDPKYSKIIYIGQNPGTEEIAQGAPFVGPSGRVLNRQLFEANVQRSELFITNQVKCLTPANRPPTDAEVRCCKPLLQIELDRCRADTVILAGDTPFKANIGTYSTLSPAYHPSPSIMQRMGCVEIKDGRKWIGTIHPAFIMRMPMFHDAPIEHLKKAWVISGQVIPPPRVIIDPAPEEVLRHKRAAFSQGRFADDVETTQQAWKYDIDEDDFIGGDWALTMCGFSAIPYEAIILSPHRISEWNDVWSTPGIVQFEHNGEYDRYHLEKICDNLKLEHSFDPLVPKNKRHDTCLGQHYLHNNMRKALKPHCVSLYTSLPYYDRSLGGVDERLYCGMDNIATLLVGNEQIRQMREIPMPCPPYVNYLELFYDIGMQALPIFEMWRRDGLNIDVRRAMLFQKLLGMKLAKGEELITKMLGPYFNWNSPKQVAELFYKKWGLPPQYNTKEDKKTKTRKKVLTCDDKAREKLDKWINHTEERRIVYKQASTYFKLANLVAETKKLVDYFNRISPDNRIHTYWKPYDETFRLASVPNIQNWPTWSIGQRSDGTEYGSLRSIIVPDHEEDYLVAFDFDQVELWTYARQFNIKYLLDIYASGEYIYGRAYEDAFQKPFFQEGKPRTKKFRHPDVTDADLLRAKAIPLGFLYGRMGESVAAEHGWPAEQGIAYKSAWYKKNPELPQAHSDIKYAMTQKGLLRPPPGFLLHYPQPHLQGINCFGQTPAFAMLMSSIILLEKEFKKRGWVGTRTALTVHDSGLINVREGLTKPWRVVEVHNLMDSILRRRVPWFTEESHYKYESKLGQQWDWAMISFEKFKEKFDEQLQSRSSAVVT
jgi:uracil-DNA glycosylase family 4